MDIYCRSLEICYSGIQLYYAYPEDGLGLPAAGRGLPKPSLGFGGLWGVCKDAWMYRFPPLFFRSSSPLGPKPKKMKGPLIIGPKWIFYFTAFANWSVGWSFTHLHSHHFLENFSHTVDSAFNELGHNEISEFLNIHFFITNFS